MTHLISLNFNTWIRASTSFVAGVLGKVLNNWDYKIRTVHVLYFRTTACMGPCTD